MQLAHAHQDGLSRFLVLPHPEGRILPLQFLQGRRQLVAVVDPLGLHRQGNDRLGAGQSGQQQGMLEVAEGVAGEHTLQAGGGDDVSGPRLVKALAAMGVHAKEPGDLLMAALAAVPDRVSSLDPPGIDAQIGQLAPFVGQHLEGQGAERAGGATGQEFLPVGVARMAGRNRRQIERRRQVGADGVKQRLNPLVTQGRAEQHGVDPALQGTPPQSRTQPGRVDLSPFEKVVENPVIEVGGRLDQGLPGCPRFFAQFVGDRFDANRTPLIVFVETQQLLVEQVDHPGESPFATQGDLQQNGTGAEPFLQLFADGPIVGADAVKLVDQTDARHPVAVGLTPDRFALRLHPLDGAEDGHRAVEHPQGALHFDGEIDMPGGVDEVDPQLPPVTAGAGGGDGDAALLLLIHPVHGRRAVMDLAHAVDLAAVEENPLGNRGLAGVDMGDDADIAYPALLQIHDHTPSNL